MRVAVAGLGLIGTSLALDLRALGHEVLGYDPDGSHLDKALGLGAVSGRLKEPLGSFDCLILAAPPRASLSLLGAPWQAPLWLDTGSVKQPICARARDLGLPFVGGHPLAGNAGQGPEAAEAGLFVGHGFALCEAGGPREAAEGLVRSLRAQPIWLDAAEHDRQVARSSHLCYAFSCALAGLLDGLPGEIVGPAAREMLRVATSPPGLWQEILELNAGAVAAAVQDLELLLREAAAGKADALEGARTAATRIRRGALGHGG